MARYFYGWIPLVVVGTVVTLTIPYLALIVLMIVLLAATAALAALAWASVSALYALGRSALGLLRRPRPRPRSDAGRRVVLDAVGVGRGGAR